MRRNLILAIAILFAVVLIMSGCKIVYKEAELRDEILETLWINTPLPPEEIALLSFHEQYVIANGEADNWAIRQETELSELNECKLFTIEYRGNGRFSLRTCHDRYITAPNSGNNREDWMLRQELEPGECGQFEMYEFVGKGVAFKTCTGRFFTAGDNGLGWEDDLRWAVVTESYTLDDWEYFTIEKK